MSRSPLTTSMMPCHNLPLCIDQFFGSEQDSPLPLRWYAHALMIKSEGLAPGLFADVLMDWKNRQLSSAGAFSCAALLAQMMIEYLQQRFLVR